MKKTVHIISHTHRDRERYMPLEQHNMRLVDLLDGVIEACSDPRFKYFQFDGQYLPIEDYLKVKPENEGILRQLISSGKIIIGPWYILQDAFLTSAESNIKDLELGIKRTKRWGEPAHIGYYPDTFGLVGQTPQILEKAGIGVAYFGRGVKATGFDNVVIEDYTSKNSEMIWKSPNGSEVIGILFANRYCNGVDIPSDPDKLKRYMDQKISDMEKYASTNQLLLMNGCDHSPVQKNIGEIIEVLNTLYEDYEFIHSNLDNYYDAMKKELDFEDIDTITGELRSQMTDGWYTLQGTSSSRYYLKKYNKTLEMRFEEFTQPLFTLFLDRKHYPHERIDYIYERILSNHPHDSICGCSIDTVHDGNVRRFKDAIEALDYLDDYAAKVIAKTTKNLSDDISFVVINTLPYERESEVNVKLDWIKEHFGADFPQIVQKLKEIPFKDFKLVDEDGKEVISEITDLGANFGYDLPDDVFRKPYFSKELNVRFTIKLKAYEKKLLHLIEEKSSFKKENYNKELIENDYYEIKINDNASLDIKDKSSGINYKNILMIEDSGDIGNEYIYRRSADDLRVLGGSLIDKSIIRENDKYIINLKEKINIPKSAAKTLYEEQITLVEITRRRSRRSDEYTDIFIEKEIKVYDNKPTIDIKIKLQNKAKDHRMRVLFAHNLDTNVVYAESIFETAKRNMYPPKSRINPDYSQNMNRFVQIKDNKDRGFSVSTIGIAEYEQIKNEGLYLTLFRAVGELGDWGYFETPDAELLGDLSIMEFDLYLDIFNTDSNQSKQRVLKERVPFFATQIGKNRDEEFIANIPEVKLGDNLYSLLYRNEYDEAILRVFNPDNDEKKITNLNGVNYNILGNSPEVDDNILEDRLKPYEIRTTKLEI